MREHKEAEDEVHAAYERFKKTRRQAKRKGTTISIDYIAGESYQMYKLFSSDHIELLGVESYWKEWYVIILHPDKNAVDGLEEDSEKEMDSGNVSLGSEVLLDLELFPLPTRARRKNVKVKGSSYRG